jgi:hypothetical protein
VLAGVEAHQAPEHPRVRLVPGLARLLELEHRRPGIVDASGLAQRVDEIDEPGEPLRVSLLEQADAALQQPA